MRVALVLVVVSVAARARAAAPTAEDLIVRGLELRRQAKPAAALELFQRAHALAPGPRTLGQMGLVETSLERWLDAETHLKAALAASNDAWVRKNRAYLDQALTLSRDHVGELVVSGPAGAGIAIDGAPSGTLPAAQSIRLVEGRAVVTATSSGFKAFSKTVAIVGGARVSLAIVLDPIEQRAAVALSAPVPLLSSTAPAAAPLVTGRDPGARSWKPPVSVGVGLLAAGAGLLGWGITWIAVDGKDDCPRGGPACRDVHDTGHAGWLLTAGGAAAAGAGALLVIVGQSTSSPRVAVDVTPSSVSLRGRF